MSRKNPTVCRVGLGGSTSDRLIGVGSGRKRIAARPMNQPNKAPAVLVSRSSTSASRYGQGAKAHKPVPWVNSMDRETANPMRTVAPKERRPR